jgi:glycosyltransferase involved in cell wall biosynthesis
MSLRPDDIVLFQRPMTELPTVMLERQVAREHPTVFDFDDAIHLNPIGARKLPKLAKLVNHVIAGNRTLAKAAGAPDKTTVIPTVVDGKRYRPQPPRAITGSAVTIGWTGLADNYEHLVRIAAPLGRAIQRTGARLLLISDGAPPPALARLGPRFLRWRAESELEDLAEIDIGLMPLPDREYERGKCAWKLIQYMALARPGVASPVGANREVVTPGVDGQLPRDEREWEECLVELIQDSRLRAEMGAAARARVDAAYTLDAVVPHYLEIFARLQS